MSAASQRSHVSQESFMILSIKKESLSQNSNIVYDNMSFSNIFDQPQDIRALFTQSTASSGIATLGYPHCLNIRSISCP